MTVTVPIRALAFVALATMLSGITESHATGNITARAERLPPLELNAAEGFSVNEYAVSSGVYYRWRIESDGREEYELLAPELFRNSWIDRVSIEDNEVRPAGLYSLEFGEEGEIDVWFVPIRPGRYNFYVENLETQGFRGVFIVE
ncbi:MAG: hypothetical protein HKM95_00485 [Inquilinus sp.]|nr:hypothetical protein [Inquilinus sp.]